MSVKQFSETFLSHYFWHGNASATPWLGEDTTYAGTITVQQALLAADGADSASVEALAAANKVLIKPPNGTVSMELRFYGDGAENVDDVVQLYAAAGADHYRHFAQLTIIIGTQDYGSYHFHDTVTPANEAWLTTVSEVSPGSDHMGSYVFNTHGNDRFLVIASDLDCTLIGVDWRRL